MSRISKITSRPRNARTNDRAAYRPDLPRSRPSGKRASRSKRSMLCPAPMPMKTCGAHGIALNGQCVCSSRRTLRAIISWLRLMPAISTRPQTRAPAKLWLRDTIRTKVSSSGLSSVALCLHPAGLASPDEGVELQLLALRVSSWRPAGTTPHPRQPLRGRRVVNAHPINVSAAVALADPAAARSFLLLLGFDPAATNLVFQTFDDLELARVLDSGELEELWLREYSDVLLMMLLKTRDPERFDDSVRRAKFERQWAKEDGKTDTAALSRSLPWWSFWRSSRRRTQRKPSNHVTASRTARLLHRRGAAATVCREFYSFEV
jgi:hypothetical protein